MVEKQCFQMVLSTVVRETSLERIDPNALQSDGSNPTEPSQSEDQPSDVVDTPPCPVTVLPLASPPPGFLSFVPFLLLCLNFIPFFSRADLRLAFFLERLSQLFRRNNQSQSVFC